MPYGSLYLRKFSAFEEYIFLRVNCIHKLIHCLLVSYTFNNLQIKFSAFDRNYLMYYSLFEGKGKRFFRYLLRRESLCFKGMFSLKPAVVKKNNWAFFLIWLKESFTREIYKNVKSASGIYNRFCSSCDKISKPSVTWRDIDSSI